ncbi:MAG: class I SAM-dependent methyltransferase [Cyclobacteriaceae bacterium]|nr:class I SAM-dependent methyltransferase [Cyclobacteriaceae bacterium]
MSQKDYFSGHAKIYAAFRPTYPKELYDFIFKHTKNFDRAWDCATGNGQVATVLSKYFKDVCATDISQQQLEHAANADNITYTIQPAEKTNFSDGQFDLITVAQALHWFDTTAFYAEAIRVAKPGAVLALWGYAVCNINPEIDKHFYHFYRETMGAYWDNARTLVENEYRDISFPFEEIPVPKFSIQVQWTADDFAGYLTSWSATQKFIKANGYNPVPEFMNKIDWIGLKTVTFPLFLRLTKTLEI